MAFVYHRKALDELTDKEMVTDVLLTHEKISYDIKEILIKANVLSRTEADRRYLLVLHGQGPKEMQILAEPFIEACIRGPFSNRDEKLLHIDDDYCMACMTYENFACTHLSGLAFEQNITESTYLRLKDKYRQYNNSVDKWFDFYMLSLDEEFKLLASNDKRGKND